jgi:transposase-like protein
MRHPASEKLEIIGLVEQSHLPAKRTLDQLGIARPTFYRWYDRYREGGPEALADRPSAPSQVWNRIPDAIHEQIVEMARTVRADPRGFGCPQDLRKRPAHPLPNLLRQEKPYWPSLGRSRRLRRFSLRPPAR